MKGEANLESALKEAGGEFLLSGGGDETPRIIIIFKNGKTTSVVLSYSTVSTEKKCLNMNECSEVRPHQKREGCVTI